jgi:glycosyltransferase involved in cell wall biosynthesis
MSEDLRGTGPRDRRDQPPVLLHVTTIPMTLTFLKGQVGYMKDRGFRVHVVSSSGPDLTRFASEEQVPVSSVDMERRITPIRDLRAMLGMWRVLRRVRPTIVHAHTPKAGMLGMITATLTRVPARIYHMRGLPLLGATGLRRWLLWWSERVSCSLAHRVLCVSPSIQEVAVRQGLVPADKLKVLGKGSGNGVDARGRFDPDRLGPSSRTATRSRLGIPPSALVIGFVGRLVRDKGIVELAAAWKVLRDRHPKAHLLLVGPFEPQDPVPPDIRESLQRDARVHLTGLDWDTPPLYAAMDVVVLPTFREGFPNVPLEAAAMGLPVVATRVPGCVDAVVEGVTGALVEPGDPRALTVAIERYLRDPGIRQRHGAAGQERVRREFRPEVIWEGVHREYLRLLEARGEPRPDAALVDGRTEETTTHGTAA